MNPGRIAQPDANIALDMGKEFQENNYGGGPRVR
jgi:hypothetical protein